MKLANPPRTYLFALLALAVPLAGCGSTNNPPTTSAVRPQTSRVAGAVTTAVRLGVNLGSNSTDDASDRTNEAPDDPPTPEPTTLDATETSAIDPGAGGVASEAMDGAAAEGGGDFLADFAAGLLL